MLENMTVILYTEDKEMETFNNMECCIVIKMIIKNITNMETCYG